MNKLILRHVWSMLALWVSSEDETNYLAKMYSMLVMQTASSPHWGAIQEVEDKSVDQAVEDILDFLQSEFPDETSGGHEVRDKLVPPMFYTDINTVTNSVVIHFKRRQWLIGESALMDLIFSWRSSFIIIYLWLFSNEYYSTIWFILYSCRGIWVYYTG